jgi:hypothetical protein
LNQASSANPPTQPGRPHAPSCTCQNGNREQSRHRARKIASAPVLGMAQPGEHGMVQTSYRTGNILVGRIGNPSVAGRTDCQSVLPECHPRLNLAGNTCGRTTVSDLLSRLNHRGRPVDSLQCTGAFHGPSPGLDALILRVFSQFLTFFPWSEPCSDAINPWPAPVMLRS